MNETRFRVVEELIFGEDLVSGDFPDVFGDFVVVEV